MENSYKNLKQKAYKIAFKFKKSELKEEIIFAKLAKYGFPLFIAKEVVMNIRIKNNYQINKDFINLKELGFIIALFWILQSTLIYAVTGSFFNAYGMLITVIPSAILGYLFTMNK